MAGQSITFDFLSRGAASLSRDFRSIGDDSALSSRGVKVLSDVIERLGAKEDRTAAESALLAKALRQTGDAADRATAKAVLADAAIRRLGDAEQDAAKKSDGLSRALGNLKPNPGLVGPLLALVPALGTLTGVVAGAGVGLAGAFVAGGAAVAAFGAVAKPVLSDAMKASQAVEKAQNNYSIAIANGTKQSVAYKAEQIAIAKAYAGLSPAQIQLSKQLGDMAKSWDAVKTAQTPLVAGALQPWLKSVTDLTKNLAPIIGAVSPVIKALGVQFDALVNSSAFKGFRDFIAGTGSRVVGAAGGTIIDLVKSFMILLPKFNPLILQMTGGIAAIGPAVLKWASSQKTADQITAFMGWFTKNGPVVGGLLTNIAGALKALAPGLTSGGALELKLISDFFGLVAKLPASFAKPLTEVAGTLLILSKLGVLKVGVQIVGAAAKWLTGGLINIGGGAAAGAEAGAAIRTAMVSGGAAAAAQIRAAMAGGGAAAGAAGSEGAAAGAAAQIKSKLPALLVPVASALAPIMNGLLLGLLIRGIGDTLSPKGTFAGKLNASLQGLAQTSGGIFSTNLLHSFTFGGLEAKLTTEIGLPVGRVLNNIGAGAKIWGGNLTSGVTGTFSSIAGGAKTWWGNVTGTISGAWRTITGTSSAGGAAVARAFGAAGAAADALRTRNLIPLLGAAGQVSGGIQGLAGIVQNTLAAGMQAGGRAADAFRTRNLIPLLGQVGKVSGGIQGLQGLISGLHGKTVDVGVHGTGSGGVQVTPSTGVPGAQNYAVFFKPLARGGRIPGFGGGDILPALLEPGEAVVDKLRARQYAPVLKAMGVPGFAAGGLAGAQGAIGLGGAINAGAEARVDINAIVAAIRKAAAKAAAAAAALAGGVSGAGPVGGDAAVNRKLMQQMASGYGWGTGAQWNALNTLEMHEAGYNRFARNPSSGAYGIPQAYPPTKMPFAAQAAGGSHAGPQIAWMLAYIRSAYRTPAAAWAQYFQHAGGVGSYAGGTSSALPGWAWVGERGPEMVRFRGGEQVIPAGQGGDGLAGLAAELRALGAKLDRLTGVAAAIPAATGAHVGGAISGAAGAAGFRNRYTRGGA